MRTHLQSATLILMCTVGLSAGAPSTSEAGLVGWPCSGYYSAYYATPASYTWYRPVYWSYRPVFWSASYRTACRPLSCCPTTTCYAPVCSPCDSYCRACYDPCARCCPTGCDPCCPSGQKTPSQTSPAPANGPADSDWQGQDQGQTYRGGQSGDSPAKDESGTDEQPYVPPDDGTGTQQNDDAFREDFKPPVPDPRDEVIQQRESAPAGDMNEGQEAEPGSTPPADEGEAGRDAARGRPRISARPELDQKLTWRTSPKRTRESARSSLVVRRVVHRRVNVNVDWTPVSGSRTIARK